MEEKTRVIVAGGGTAGWLTAYSLVTRLGNLLDITLVESDQIGTVGVGDATVPTICSFHHVFKVDEREFMRPTQATFKLGIFFDHWGAPGESYIHSFGDDEASGIIGRVTVTLQTQRVQTPEQARA